MKLRNPVIENNLLEVSLPEYHAVPTNNAKPYTIISDHQTMQQQHTSNVYCSTFSVWTTLAAIPAG